MSQGTVLVGALLAGFVVWLTIQGRLNTYLAIVGL